MTLHWLAYAFHILAAIDLLKAVPGMRPEELLDPFIYGGVLRHLQTIFESTQKLPKDIKEQHPDVRWQDFHNLRNVLVHEYLGNFFVEDAQKLITTDLPLLEQAMLQHLPNWREVRDTFADSEASDLGSSG